MTLVIIDILTISSILTIYLHIQEHDMFFHFSDVLFKSFNKAYRSLYIRMF